jgi:DNA modification methylase
MEIVEKFELGKFLTFEPSKDLPIYNWFYYKEAFSPQFVEWAIKNFYSGGIVLDPFCGIGTTNLFCKMNGIDSIGLDVSPIAILSSKVKCNFDIYDLDSLSSDIQKLEEAIKKGESEGGKWYFELFPPSRAFPKNYDKDIIFIKNKIEEIESNLNKDFFMLALLSIIPQCSLVIKDGGVLRIDKTKSAAPPKIMFFRKIKKMYNDLVEVRKNITTRRVICEILDGDARRINLNEKVSLIITSPPYLNNVDYTKVYGLELSLLKRIEEIREIRNNSFRSFLDRDVKKISLNEEVRKILDKRLERGPLVAYAYFDDIYKFLVECKKVLSENGKAIIVIGNSFIGKVQINVDEILAEISEVLNFKSKIYVGQIRKTKIGKRMIMARESIIELSKKEKE